MARAEGEHDRPWERRGAVRRDCEPHRGELLVSLGKISWYLALVSLVTVVPAAVAAGLALAVVILAGRDRELMEWGVMDPSGGGQLREAQYYAGRALVFALVWPTALAMVVFVLWWCP